MARNLSLSKNWVNFSRVYLSDCCCIWEISVKYTWRIFSLSSTQFTVEKSDFEWFATIDRNCFCSANSTLARNFTKKTALLRPWQTRRHCCGHTVADTNVSQFARVPNICGGLKFCVRDTKNVSDFVQKHFVSATNVSQFAQPKKNHGQQCVRNNVSSFARALIHFVTSSKNDSSIFKFLRKYYDLQCHN